MLPSDPAGEPPGTDRDRVARLRSGLSRLGCRPVEVAAVGLLIAGGLAALLVLWLLARPSQPAAANVQFAEPVEPAATVAQTASAATATDPGAQLGPVPTPAAEVTVHVAGKVVAPGVYRLPAASRVIDALDAAGGPHNDATIDAINLARPLVDGEQLLVPGPGVPAAPPPGPATAGAAGAARRPDGTLDLNRATVDDLDDLPGIGPVLAGYG